MGSWRLQVPVVDEVEEHIGQVKPESDNSSLEVQACRVECNFERNSHHLPFFWWQVFEFEEDKVGDSLRNVGLLMWGDFKELLYRWC